PDDAVFHLDGRPDEPAGRLAPAITQFRQYEPQEGAPATEETEVRVLYNRSALLISVVAHDREPDQVIGRILQRDKILMQGMGNRYGYAGDDLVAVLIDPFHDRRNAHVSAVNPAGAEFDALITDESRMWNIEWRGIWRAAAARTADGWSAELEIPFRTLRYPENADGERTWGFNVYRVIRRKNEEVMWQSWMRGGGGFHRVSQAGVLRGLTDLPRSGWNIELKPIGVLGRTKEQGFAVENTAHLGVDAKWEVSPGLVLDLTMHPDFAQVESDDERVNLTRFELFYPEKREFFLENAGLFEFGTQGTFEPPPFLMFMSRSIGIKDGRATPLIGGVRLSGRVGRQTIGLLDMMSSGEGKDPRTNFSVFRYKRDIGASNYIGFAATDRRNGAEANTVAGLDASFWLKPTLNFQTFIARTQTSGRGGDDFAGRAALEYSGDRFGLSADVLQVGPEVQAAMGFVTRTDIRRVAAFGRYTWRPGGLGIRKIDFFLNGARITRLDGEIQDRRLGQFIETEWESGETLAVFNFASFTRLNEGFTMNGRIPIPPGDYDSRENGFMLSTSRKRAFSAELMAGIQRQYEGRIDNAMLSLNWTPTSHLALEARHQFSRVRLPWGEFDSPLASLRVIYSFSTRLTAQTWIQYNRLDDRLVLNARLHYLYRPGSDFYLVFNDERNQDGNTPFPNRKDAAVKLTYLFRI
ncbi:MAG: carbohydrate binding family 9 domain-containing protein, partial [candidate division KSB1 bacterium]|nr:carbohydrate binding family 9 domain-containing protein [candidate division KSB1 bacterium]